MAKFWVCSGQPLPPQDTEFLRDNTNFQMLPHVGNGIFVMKACILNFSSPPRRGSGDKLRTHQHIVIADDELDAFRAALAFF